MITTAVVVLCLAAAWSVAWGAITGRRHESQIHPLTTTGEPR